MKQTMIIKKKSKRNSIDSNCGELKGREICLLLNGNGYS
jgi:hypothetical protein